MGKFSLFLVSLLIALSLCHENIVSAAGTEDGSEQWGYVEVRPQAHLFWWLYKSPFRVEDPSKPWPVILWLQGGPGASGVGLGNFLEIGPLDGNLKPRNSTWLQKADLLFVDSPVGTGYSYVDDVHNSSLTVKTDVEAAIDVTTLLKEVFNGNESLQRSPLYVVAESYGGKFAVTVGLSILEAIEAGELKLKLGGVALGDSWISSEDFVLSWGPLLKAGSRIDNSGLRDSNSLTQIITQQLKYGQYEEATQSWYELEGVILSSSNNVDFYNIMLDSKKDPIEGTTNEASKQMSTKRYSKYLDSPSLRSAKKGLSSLMNGVIREKLKIIPTGVKWGGQEDIVFPAMVGEFMKPRIKEVDELLAKGINVTIYNGQLDLICSTAGAEAWVEKLKWDGLDKFLSLDRTPLYCGGDGSVTKGFMKSYKNLYFYWILGAGHFVPVDQPCVTLEMIGSITQSPNTS
ncbi:Serine carboxypeptidase-like [Thalictrum thalictroides]|uniref:Carboxypeptidase n=1 Tax=Thalictrum thalictroides TaxID=46969 RepID=A0A7J6VNG6_THATH|nr:Serine carboxypeptidase-like [Thalictrum thalictroides]